MHILLYGYGSHARRIKSCCLDYFKECKDIFFSGIKRQKIDTDISLVSSIDEATSLYGKINCVFIASSNSSHLEIFKKCLDKKIEFIYVEKPATGIQEFFESSSADTFLDIKYIQIGYHFNYSKPLLSLGKSISSKEFGELIRLDIFAGHGLAFKDEFKKTWRAKDKDALIDTALSHLVNLSIKLCSIEEYYNLTTAAKYNEIHGIKDTQHVSFCGKQGALLSISSSWGSPFEQSIKAYFSNAIWEYDFTQVVLKSPRDSFDQNGFFQAPNKSIEKYNFEGIKSSVFHFLNQVTNNRCKKHEFNNSRLTSVLLDEIKCANYVSP